MEDQINKNLAILDFVKVNKIKSTEEHNREYSNDSGIAYVPNMSEEDQKKFKAKHISGEDERVEIRVTMGKGTNILIIVYKYPKKVEWKSSNYKEWAKNHNNIQISMNGKLDMTFDELKNINQAITEAKQLLKIFNIGDYVRVKEGLTEWMRSNDFWVEHYGDSIDGKKGIITNDYSNHPNNYSYSLYIVNLEGLFISINSQWLEIVK
jgi:hypothetical protein